MEDDGRMDDDAQEPDAEAEDADADVDVDSDAEDADADAPVVYDDEEHTDATDETNVLKRQAVRPLRRTRSSSTKPKRGIKRKTFKELRERSDKSDTRPKFDPTPGAIGIAPPTKLTFNRMSEHDTATRPVALSLDASRWSNSATGYYVSVSNMTDVHIEAGKRQFDGEWHIEPYKASVHNRQIYTDSIKVRCCEYGMQSGMWFDATYNFWFAKLKQETYSLTMSELLSRSQRLINSKKLWRAIWKTVMMRFLIYGTGVYTSTDDIHIDAKRKCCISDESECPNFKNAPDATPVLFAPNQGIEMMRLFDSHCSLSKNKRTLEKWQSLLKPYDTRLRSRISLLLLHFGSTAATI